MGISVFNPGLKFICKNIILLVTLALNLFAHACVIYIKVAIPMFAFIHELLCLSSGVGDATVRPDFKVSPPTGRGTRCPVLWRILFRCPTCFDGALVHGWGV